MKKKYQNAFFAFGIAVLILMASQLDFAEAWKSLTHAGYWFFAVVALWAFLYVFNTCSWWIIIRSGEDFSKSEESGSGCEDSISRCEVRDTRYEDSISRYEVRGTRYENSGANGIQAGETALAPRTPHLAPRNTSPTPRISFPWLYKVTVSGFALNYATPGGLMGGEPYRMMMLAPKIGTERASSSVILYVMTHIFSHFWFWLLSVPLYLITQHVSTFMAIVLSVMTGVCLLAIWFFMKGYRRGLAVSGMNLLRHIPFVKRWAIPFVEKHREQLDTIDRQIAALHNQSPRTFWTAVGLELSCRIASALEVLFTLLVFMPSVNYFDCILVISFTTLFANMLFFMPLQLGGREGGFLMSITGLGFGLTAEAALNAAIFVALIVRIRELIWTAIGLLLIKLEKR